MFSRVKNFVRSENGAVTVDWVVLCAGVVAIAVAIVVAMQTGAVNLSDDISSYMSNWF